MSSAQTLASNGLARTATGGAEPIAPSNAKTQAEAVEAMLGAADDREKFIPVTRHALMERLTRTAVWPSGDAVHARRFFRYLDYWRQQSYCARLLELEKSYEPFSPDSDLLITRKYTAAERARLQTQVVAQVEQLLVQANYTRIDPAQVEVIMTRDSHYGLDLQVDLAAFDELAIFYRGAATGVVAKRTLKKLYLQKEEFEFPIFQRLCVLFKLKPFDVRVQEVIRERTLSQDEAERHVRRLRSSLPPQVKSDNIYLKLFKNIPRTDLEMVFPNTKIRFRLFDKLKLGVTAGGGLGMGVVGTASKIAVATNPIALAGAVVGLGGIAARQAINFINQKNRYMVTMAQNLYFHSMADNRGVMTLLADRAAEEDIKEEILLYSVLAKERVTRADLPDIDRSIEQYLLNTFGVTVNFDVEDALTRLMRDGIVAEQADGTLKTLPPAAAAVHIDVLWDKYLDELPDFVSAEGYEFDLEDERPSA